MADEIYKKQNITLEDRKRLVISGVIDVENFDDNGINVITNMGVLSIKGVNIKIEKLSIDSQEITATGEFYLLEYISDEHTKGGFFKRMFK